MAKNIKNLAFLHNDVILIRGFKPWSTNPIYKNRSLNVLILSKLGWFVIVCTITTHVHKYLLYKF